MSEYWKSTPKYWCKHCKTFVRDTKLEKANHEATPKHQGNLKRFLRDLHRGHEKDEKDKERAKAEVARLNGLSTGGGTSAFASTSSSARPTPAVSKAQITPAQRKQQLAQLAEMGISIPDEFRPDMAMVGDWQVTSERVIEGDDSESKPDAIALGIRKRAAEEEDEEAVEAKKRRWGSTYKTHPAEDEEGDLDTLLKGVTGKGKGPATKAEVIEERKSDIKDDPETATAQLSTRETGDIKQEPSEEDPLAQVHGLPLDTSVKLEGEHNNVTGVVFKKRKTKNIRQK